MEPIMNFLEWQAANLVSLPSLLTFFLGFGLIYIVFLVIYKIQDIQYLNPVDRKFSLFEKEYYMKWLQYLPWAFVQQSLLTIPLHYLELPLGLSYLIAVIIFGCVYHFPNVRLMVFTILFGMAFYLMWFFYDAQSLVYVSILHAFGGTAYYKVGWDMRVWRF